MPSNVELVGLAKDLQRLEESGKRVRVGIIGSGEMGIDLVTQIAQMDGLEVAGLTSRNVKNAVHAGEIAYGSRDYTKEVSNQTEMLAAQERGMIPVTGDNNLLLENEHIDVIVDATGIPEVGASIGPKVIEHGKHLVMMNVEADVCIGPRLKALADEKGVIYSLGAGDEPSSCMELIEFVTAMGHQVVSAGKGKNNPLDFNAVPDDFQEEADRRNMNVRMLVEFVEGSKTMVEMAAIANATGLLPDTPGMHGPSATVDQLASVLIPKEDGGVLSKSGCVDYSIGKGVSPGVFVVIKAEHPRVHERMADLKMGDGPYFTFHRPYHLTSLEVPLTCAKVVLTGRPDMVPLSKPVAEVCAVAKRDMRAGETFGAVGEYDYRAWTMTAEQARRDECVPCGLLQGASVLKDIKKGEVITYAEAKPDPASAIVKLRQEQDRMLGLV